MVYIDPGHGGRDPGAIGPSGVQEKRVALRVAQKVYEGLFKVCQVKLTREDDRALGANESADLEARVRMANSWPADLFISIHCNSAGSQAAHGTETFCYSPSGEGYRLANLIQSKLTKHTGLNDRGVATGNFAVLRETKMPAVLVELGFISNPTEETLLNSEDFHNHCAKAIVEGVCNYLNIKQCDNAQEAPQVPSWASAPIQWALSNEIITNKSGSDDFYRFITILYNYHNKLGGQ